MKRIILAVVVIAAVAATVFAGDMLRSSKSISLGSNSVQTVVSTNNDRGLLYRLGVSLTGGTAPTCIVTVADIDGTAIFSGSVAGSTNYTPAAAIPFVGATITCSNANKSNLTATVNFTAAH